MDTVVDQNSMPEMYYMDAVDFCNGQSSGDFAKDTNSQIFLAQRPQQPFSFSPNCVMI
jgi:hypothetical protein